MANEALKRTPTSTGNRKVWTWSGWIKRNKLGVSQYIFNRVFLSSSNFELYFTTSDTIEIADYTSGYNIRLITTQNFRDVSSWYHILLVIDTTSSIANDRVKLFVNGNRITSFGTQTTPSINLNTQWNNTQEHQFSDPSGAYDILAEMTDVYMIDGQALTPDVFGFNKVGKGYISVGSTQATDFRPGQWVPKTPRVIKTEINRRGGFGVNGFYLPMNDSRNFGADFHGEPNSIITLNEKLPQPRVGVASTAVGIGYTDVLRADPFAANLVLALPFVSSGLCTNGTNVGVNTGFGDYSHIIRGSGSAKIPTTLSNVSIANTASYYGSSVQFTSSSYGVIDYGSVGSDLDFGSGDFTVEFWVNQTDATTERHCPLVIKGNYTVNNNHDWRIYCNDNTSPNTQLRVEFKYGGTTYSADGPTSGAVLGTNQWNHVAVVKSGRTLRSYINGVAVGINTNLPTSSIDNSYNALTVGRGNLGGAGDTALFGYLQDLRVYKGVAKYTGGFDVPRPYTPVGIATWRAVPDTTANNFATMNPLDYQTTGTYGSSFPILTEGNTLYTHGTTGQWERSNATVGIPTTRSWYMEYNIVTRPASPPGTSENWAIGLRESDGRDYHKCTDGYEDIGDHIYWIDAGTAKIISSQDSTAGSTSGISTMVNGDILNIAVTRTSVQSKIWFGKNGNYFNSGNPASGTNAAITTSTTSSYLIPSQAWYQYSGQNEPVCSVNFGQNPSFGGRVSIGTFTDTSGKGVFKYQPPSGFLALCEDNLPTPAISDPGKYFRSVLYTGDGASGRSIVGVGFTPDLVWIKARNIAYSNRLFDSVRGTGIDNFLLSNLTSAEGDYADQFGGISSFNSDGFSMVFGSRGSNIGINNSGSTFVAWCWRAGAGTTSTNTNGSITSVVSVNQDAGFSVVSYTGNGTNPSTVGHGLNKAPSLIINKNRSADSNWVIQHNSLGWNQGFLGWSTVAATSSTAFSNNTAPTNNVFTIGNYSVNNNQKYIAYCWAEIEGLSKFGSFVGNGNADGPFIFCNFSPAFVLIKRATGGTGNWAIFDNSRDSTNPVFGYLVAESSAVEERGTAVIDFTSNGFKIRNSWTTINSSGDTIIFAAFAQSPFAYSNSK
jgi:hypothetical protein